MSNLQCEKVRNSITPKKIKKLAPSTVKFVLVMAVFQCSPFLNSFSSSKTWMILSLSISFILIILPGKLTDLVSTNSILSHQFSWSFDSTRVTLEDSRPSPHNISSQNFLLGFYFTISPHESSQNLNECVCIHSFSFHLQCPEGRWSLQFLTLQ